ncbi:MAG: PilN domain-containing protein [Nitrospira sp.]|nr:PilN domain-containing protein [Nitrospira sp.]
MIRINLLPEPRTKGVKKQWDVRIEAAGAAVTVALVVVACFYYAGLLDEEIEAKQRTKQDKEKQIAALQQQVKQVEDFEKKKKLLEDKNRIIDQLEKRRGGPVRTMDYISQSLEPLKLWLVKLEVKEKQIDLDGKALSQDDIVEFINNLRRTEHFTDIRLLESRAAVEGKTTTYQFKISAGLKG